MLTLGRYIQMLFHSHNANGMTVSFTDVQCPMITSVFKKMHITVNGK